jgi:alcohol dehydrogenase (cytochrome c)
MRAPVNRTAHRLSILAVAALALSAATSSHAVKPVTWDDIANDAKTSEDVLTYGLGLTAQRYSPLKKVNAKTIANMVPVWSYSFGGEKQRGQEGQVLVHDGA